MKAKDMKAISVKAPEDLIKAFVATCKNMDTDASKEIRAHMRKVVAQSGQAKLI